MILALITSPITFSGFAFGQEESEELDSGDAVEILDSVEIELETAEGEVEYIAEDDADVIIDQSAISNLGQEVSNFVKESRALFEQQKVETKAVI